MRGKGKKPKITCKERSAFLYQRWGAWKRGIAFHFTYEEWLYWWKTNLGPDWFALRGNSDGKYVMARNGDKGPYVLNNVKCITMNANCKEALSNENRGNAKLNKAQVTTIYLELRNGPRGTAMKLAKKFNVSDITIRSIGQKLTWAHITNLLD